MEQIISKLQVMIDHTHTHTIRPWFPSHMAKEILNFTLLHLQPRLTLICHLSFNPTLCPSFPPASLLEHVSLLLLLTDSGPVSVPFFLFWMNFLDVTSGPADLQNLPVHSLLLKFQVWLFMLSSVYWLWKV